MIHLSNVLGTHQEVEALQLLLMVMSISHVPNETPKPSRIRVSKIRVYAHHTPLNIILLDACSSWKSSMLRNVSLRKSFRHLLANVHQPLYSIFFGEGRAPTIASNILYRHPFDRDYKQPQSDDVLQSLIGKGVNRLICPLPEIIPVDSTNSWEPRESHLFSYQTINTQTYDPIHNIFVDTCLVTANDNHI